MRRVARRLDVDRRAIEPGGQRPARDKRIQSGIDMVGKTAKQGQRVRSIFGQKVGRRRTAAWQARKAPRRPDGGAGRNGCERRAHARCRDAYRRTLYSSCSCVS